MTTPYNQTREKYTLYNSLTPASPSQLPIQSGKVVEGLVEVDEEEVVDMYNRMNTNTDTQRKYDMDRHISYPPSHPEFAPTEKEIMIKDSTEIMNQQYNTMIMTIAATASLGLIAYMVSTNTSSPSA
jgi:hypothetical protein